MSKKKYWMLINYVNAKPNEDDWEEVSWLEETPLEMMIRFIDSLHPGERAREVIMFEEIETGNKPHSWYKSNLVTISKGGEYYDTYRCEECGITGKRFGLGGTIVLDKRYKKKVYCK